VDSKLHLVLGGSGAIGRAVIKELLKRGLPVKAVERSKTVEGTETIKADLLDLIRTKEVIHGAGFVYLCVGLLYRSKYWRENWPRLMKNVIQACSESKSKLIFFDNWYMYGPPPLPVPIVENSPQSIQTKKGLVRKETADILLKAHKNGSVKALIGRSADFYGPTSLNSGLYVNILKRMLEGKNPQWIGDPKTKHTYAYINDDGQALVDLALDESCYGEVWHLPVEKPTTTYAMLDLFNAELGKTYKLSVMPKPMLKILSIFIKDLKELDEMSYQFEYDFVMSDKKFRSHFPQFKTTSYNIGVKEMVDSFRTINK
jgi:nucleoside-diphosphate-sugar epimerase